MAEDVEFPGALRDRYEPRGLLGKGAFGAVHRALDRELGREVAIKVLRGDAEGGAAARFQREAALLAGLRHPGIVEIYDFGVAGATRYLIMELLRGETFVDAPPDDPLGAVLDAAEALEVVHGAGVVHRDIKPANLIRTPEGRVVLLDFGLARADANFSITRTGALVGTLAYLAPEVWTTGEAGPASDWYALGVTLYLLAEGEFPRSPALFHGDLLPAPLPPVRYDVLAPGSPAQRVTAALLEADPAARPASAAALRDLARTPGPPRATPASKPMGASPTVGTRPPARGDSRRGLAAVAVVAVLALATAWPSGEVPSRPGRLPGTAAPTAPRPGAASDAEVETWARVARALEEVGGAHRTLAGGYSFARRDSTPGDHLGEVLREHADPRVVSRRRRLLEALPRWLATAPEERAARRLREDVLPLLDHLASDVTLLAWYQAEHFAFASPDPAVLRREVMDPPTLASRIGELVGLRMGAIEALAPWSDRHPVLLARALLAGATPTEVDQGLFQELLTEIRATRDLAARAALARGFLLVGPSALTSKEEFPCEGRAALVEALEGILRAPEAPARVEAATLAHLAGTALYQNHLHLQACVGAAGPGDRARVLRLLEAIDRTGAADPGPGMVALEMVLIFHRRGGFLTSPFGEGFDTLATQLDRVHRRLDTSMRGTPRGWEPGFPPHPTRDQGPREGGMR